MTTTSRMRRFAVTSSISLTALSAFYPVVCAGIARPNPTSPKESWTGLYFNGKKIGYTSVLTQPATFGGKPALKLTTTSVARIEMFGKSVAQDTTGFTIVDTTYKPLHSEFNISSNGSQVRIVADYLPRKIVCTVNSGGVPVKKEVAVPPGANLSADSNDVVQGKKLAVGQKMTFYFLEPLSISLMKSDIEVQGEDELSTDSGTVKAFRVSATTPVGGMTTWQSSAGELLKGELPFGMAMYRESRERAKNLTTAPPRFVLAGAPPDVKTAYAPPKDFAQATAVTTDRTIAKPREAHSLSLLIQGVDDPKLIISDSRQRAEKVDAGWNLLVTAKRFDESQSAQLPIRDSNVQMQLSRAPYLEIDDPQITKTAASLRGTDTNAFRVAAKIHDWVHSHMTPDYSIGVPRSCAEINGKRRGVCRDYATLFAGIARAAGIPTRVCGGMLFAEGKFFYHAWAECWVGEWVPFDPTLPANDFVDATHIKFAQGDVTDMFQVAGVIGRVKVTIRATD